jgi:hypothetical protein
MKIHDTYPQNKVHLNLEKPSLQFLYFLAQVNCMIPLRMPETFDLLQQVQCVLLKNLIDRDAARGTLQRALISFHQILYAIGNQGLNRKYALFK